MAAEGHDPATAVRDRRRTGAAYVPGLDGYRATAAFMVLVFHVAGTTGLTREDGLISYAIRPFGILGVSIFFVMSGFLLYRPFVRAHLRDEPMPPIGTYLLRRGLRIFPAYWCAFVFYVYVFGSPDETIHGLGDLVKFVTLQHGYDAGTVLAGVPVAWTLTVEVSFYVFLPVFALAPVAAAGKGATPRERLQTQLVLVVALLALAPTIRFLLIDSESELVNVFPAMLDWFAVGMAIAVVRAWFDEGNPRPRAFETLWRRPEIGLIGVAAAYGAVISMQLPGGLTRLGLGQHMGRNTLYAVIGLCLVAPVALGADGRRPLLRVLENPVARWLGMVSYGIYLWHVLVLNELRPVLIDHLGMGTGFWPALVTTSLGAVAVAAASWYLLERPIIAFGRVIEPDRPTARARNVADGP